MAERFSWSDKVKAMRRELAWRRKVFPNRVANGRMTQAEMNRQIAVFEAIEQDLDRARQRDAAAGDLFGGQ